MGEPVSTEGAMPRRWSRQESLPSWSCRAIKCQTSPIRRPTDSARKCGRNFGRKPRAAYWECNFLVLPVIVASHGFTLAWGTVPEGIGVILTSLSILIAALAYRRSVSDREREQASKINAWVEIVNGDEEGGYHVVVRNDSDLPIRNLLMTWDNDIVPEEPSQWQELMVRPKSEERCKQKEYMAPDTPISCVFLDAAGRYWKRGKDGSLSRIKKRPPYAAQMYGWMQEINRMQNTDD